MGPGSSETAKEKKAPVRSGQNEPTDKRILGLITARGGSKGIPGKNLKPLAGKPLIAWTIEAAIESNCLDRIVVSTDDREIARVAEEWGVQVPFIRPAALAQDHSSHISVIEHAMGWLDENEDYRPEYLLLLQPTSPLRTAEDIKGIVDMAVNRKAEAVVSVCSMAHHPYLAYTIGQDGLMQPIMHADMDYTRRQILPQAFVLNGSLYVNRRESLLQKKTIVPENTYAFEMPPERSVDIDSPWDFHLVELIIRDRNMRPCLE